MEVFRINIKTQSDKEKHQVFKDSLHNCPLCQTPLEFEVDSGPEQYQVVETARCQACNIDVRSEMHVLQ